MEILVITDLYPVSGSELCTPKTIYNFVQSWKKQGHNVRIIKPNFLFNSFLRGKPFYKRGIYGDVENVNYFLPFCGNIKNKLDKSFPPPDIVTAHMPSGLIFADKLGFPFCAAVHVSDLEVLSKPVYRFYFKKQLEHAYQNASKIACRTPVLKKRFLELYPQYENKVFIAPSGIDRKIIYRRKWKNPDRIKVLTCAQFIKRKNIDKVIRACEKFENIDLTVIGSGKLERALKKISEKPKFTGELPHNKVLEKMRESDIFILPSVNETFGLVYLEAMASGCITVCTENDGIAGIITDEKNGFLTPPDKVEETIRKILKHKDLERIMENAYSAVSDLTLENTAVYYLKKIISSST